MKVLIISRSTLYSSPGGDSVQIIETAKAVRELGVEVDIKLTNETINYDKYDLIHFFNIIRPNDIIYHVNKSNKKFVVSTIFVDYSEYEKLNRTGILGTLFKILSPDQLEFVKSIARYIVNGEKINGYSYYFKGHKGTIEHLLNKASLLLPNSDSEYNRLKKRYSFDKDYIKVPNAVSTDFIDKSSENKREGVICVGRIEGRKNQLNLIRALKGTNIPLTIIGNYSPNHKSYYDLCVAEAGENVTILGHLGKDEIIVQYKKHKAHILPSWFETTGLSSLESATMGCNVIVTAKGDTQEYFGEDAFYCEPDDLNSIRTAVEEAIKADFNTKLKEKIVAEYSWGKAAEKTVEAYKKTIQSN
ncbi:MAG: glycosyl transferase family 1 [Flavobacteriales bacterium]|nr:MAG: glycosyl transferase family 1 [Flavobacteriales bacterium]